MAKVKGKHTKDAVEARVGTTTGEATPQQPPITEQIPVAQSNPSTEQYEPVGFQGYAYSGAQPPAKRGGGVLKGIGIFIGIVAAIYLIGIAVFSFMFMPNTTLNGTDVSLGTSAAISQKFKENVDGYSAKVSGDGIDTTISAKDVGLKLDTDAYVQSALHTVSAWAWPYEIFQKHTIDSAQTATLDETKLTGLLSAKVTEINTTATQPVNAYVGFDDASAQFVVQPEVYGTAINPEALVANIADGMDSLQPTITLDEESLLKPSLLKDDTNLAASAKKCNDIIATTISLTVSGSEVASVTAAQAKDWLDFDEAGNPTLNKDKITEWTKGALSEQLDTVGTTRSYTRPDGKAVTVAGGTYGWIIDGTALGEAIYNQLSAANGTAIEVPMSQTAAVHAGAGQPDWGPSFVDIDLSEQYVRYYDASGACVWETSCVSGDVSQDHLTPEGAYFINSYMESGNVKLTGRILASTGEPEYISYVTYWMPFIDNAYALHDASWRGSFGGSINQYNGSHGCVNLPSSAAASLYDLVSVGTPVIVHY